MRERCVYITTASWEPRFLLGAKRILSSRGFSTVICFWFEEFAARTEAARSEFECLGGIPQPKMVPLPMYRTVVPGRERAIPAYVTVWKKIKETLDAYRTQFDTFVLDVTTMPREALWITLDLLSDRGTKGSIAYHRAERHGDWCGLEPERPHIVPKLGGLPALNRPTRLLIVSGYDGDRSEQFIASYEPQETVILYQEFPIEMNVENREKNQMRHMERFGGRGKAITLHGVNCYEADWGFLQIYEAATRLAKNANVILASLGPKTSAVSIYRVHRHLLQTSLVYAPCRDYNEVYSFGIGQTLWLEWNPALELSPQD